MEKAIYRDCQRNHACNFGGYAIDGCRHFIPSNTMGLGIHHCKACGCHRNYHRKLTFTEFAELSSENGGLIKSSFWSLREAKRIARQRCVLLPGTTPSSSMAESCKVKKRKSKFSKKQKEAMREFAESLGWSMRNKGRGDEINRFCEKIGVNRLLFKTWLNNNKRVYFKNSASASQAKSSSSSKAV
ncbi:hypothetical protein COLO4_27576 [Corchorus olitorius]|uniref:ZF-HD dimerization-type domain-containing protein n=1 Tax=Corchorus olitorius TaxID=93759 RepID=A0A1R3HQJ5_9ROSI|nr:hypothetical protein COLO4_27576 [Corchorus olitorius]